MLPLRLLLYITLYQVYTTWYTRLLLPAVLYIPGIGYYCLLCSTPITASLTACLRCNNVGNLFNRRCCCRLSPQCSSWSQVTEQPPIQLTLEWNIHITSERTKTQHDTAVRSWALATSVRYPVSRTHLQYRLSLPCSTCVSCELSVDLIVRTSKKHAIL